MRNKLLLCLMAMLPLAIVSCGDEKNSPEEKKVEGKLVKNEDIDDFKRGFVSYQYADGVLELKHHVLYGNTGSPNDSIRAVIRSQGDEISIEETIDITVTDGWVASDAYTKQLTYQIKNVKQQKYHVCITTYDTHLGYDIEDDCFDIDLSATQCDSLRLQRTE